MVMPNSHTNHIIMCASLRKSSCSGNDRVGVAGIFRVSGTWPLTIGNQCSG